MSDDDVTQNKKTIMASEVAAMTPDEAGRFFKENPDVDVELGNEFWENAKPVYDKDNPTKLVAMAGKIIPKKGG